MIDSLLSAYSIIILDEVHERTVATDILLPLIKELLTKRSDLKLILMSATVDYNKFLQYFNSAPLIKVPGRLFSVQIVYTKEPVNDYIKSSVDTIIQIHKSEPPGDILVFLTGEQEIEAVCNRVAYIIQTTVLSKEFGLLVCIPLYSSLHPSLQQKIFVDIPGTRKVIVSTNIAETSLTIDGVVYVIDCGFSKQKQYNPRTRLESLQITPISKASATQRTGRAGRTRAGKCYRLYTESVYNQLMEQNIPEILRSNLSSILLQLKVLGVNNLAKFEWLDRPNTESLLRAIETLHYLQIIDNDSNLTTIGHLIAQLPLDPQLAKVLIQSSKYGCSGAMTMIVAMLSAPSVYVVPNNAHSEAQQIHSRFIHSDGDHLTLLNIFQAYNQQLKSQTHLRWCWDNFLSDRSLANAHNIYNQLSALLKQFKLWDNSKDSEDCSINVRKCLVEGFFLHTVHLESTGHFTTIHDQQVVHLHPCTSIHQPYKSNWFIYNEFIRTTKNFIRALSPINPEWLIDIAPHYFRLNSLPQSNAKTILNSLYHDRCISQNTYSNT